MIRKCAGCQKSFESDRYKTCDACRVYINKYSKEHRQENREYARKYRQEHREQLRQKAAVYRQENHEVIKEKHPAQNKQYRELHPPAYRVTWEQYFKVKIPKGFAIHHKDGDWKNDMPDNLLCLTHDEHRRLHHIKAGHKSR